LLSVGEVLGVVVNEVLGVVVGEVQVWVVVVDWGDGGSWRVILGGGGLF
jgi:hypothetical protein